MSPPPIGNLSILQHLINSYKAWNELRHHLPKQTRYTLAEKVDILFIETLECIFKAQYASAHEKLIILKTANSKFDTLKFFLQLLWETKSLSNRHYELLSAQLAVIGKMLGGWLKQSLKQNSPAH